MHGMSAFTTVYCIRYTLYVRIVRNIIEVCLAFDGTCKENMYIM